ncbi:MAG: hypothetical protein WKF91_07225 [Segetibacter sp.]
MTRKWDKIGESKYSFSVDNNIVGEMEIMINSIDSKATFQIKDEKFIIKRAGFWKSSIEIINSKQETVAKTYFEKWYANSSVLEYGDKKYKLIVHNNPLAEYSIINGNKNLLAYGLNTDNGKVNVKITSENSSTDFLLDFLLWYLFIPIASENMGDNFTFLMLTTTQ